MSRDVHWGKLGMHSFISLIFSLSFLIPMKLFLWFFLHPEVKSEINVKKLNGPLIIACNHTSWADPFLIGYKLPLDSKIFPIHFAILNKIYHFPFVFPLLWLLGTFPVKRRIGLDESLKVPVNILNRGGVVGIFPEGKRQWKGGPGKPKRGVAYLAFKTGTQILPIRIITPVIKMTAFGVLSRRYRLKVKIGKPFYLPSKTIKEVEDYNQPANYVINRIRQL